MTRDERQLECSTKWIKAGCKGLVSAATGFGKTRVGILSIKRFLNKNPTGTILVVVPSEPLQIQWIEILSENKINAEVYIINSVIKKKLRVDLLILDEVHLFVADTFIKVFTNVKYSMILALTATLNRLDGKEILLNKYCPICDVITLEECIENNWASPYKEYKVMLEVDLTDYIEAHRAFLDFFSFFNYDFNFAMKCVTNRETRIQYAKLVKNKNEDEKEIIKKVTANAFGFLINLKKRKAFVMEHPKKIEITNLIIEHRLDKKIVTFSPTIKMAEKIKYGNLLNSGIKKKKRRITLSEFILQETGVLNSNKSINTGTDIPGLNTAIILSGNSSSIIKQQTLGRVIRYAPGKEAEVFTLVIKGTMEESWHSKSTKSNSYITISEENLIHILKGEKFTSLKNVEKDNNLLRF